MSALAAEFGLEVRTENHRLKSSLFSDAYSKSKNTYVVTRVRVRSFFFPKKKYVFSDDVKLKNDTNEESV